MTAYICECISNDIDNPITISFYARDYEDFQDQLHDWMIKNNIISYKLINKIPA